MARINIEDSLFKKRAWMKFLMLTQDEDRAFGAIVRAFILAQKYWYPDRKRIPRKAWEDEGMNEQLIESGLAEESGDGIYIKGSEDSFAWLFQKSDAGAKGGKKSAQRPRDEKGHFLPNTSQAEPVESKHRLDNAQAETKHTQTSSSISSSISCSSSNSDSNSFSEEGKASDDAGPSPVELFSTWNQFRGELPKAQKLTNVRKTAARARLKDNPNLEYWREIITKLASTPFTLGHNNRGWKADFDFLLRPDTHIKVSEGKYQGSGKPSLRPVRNSANDHIWEEIAAMEARQEREVGNDIR